MAGSQDFAADPRNAGALIYLNGKLVPRDQAKVSIFDGGFVVGDGVWEGLRLHKGALLFLQRHLDRLYWGADRIGLDIGLDRDALTAEIRRTLDTNGMRDGVHLRVMVTRGEKAAPNQDPRNALGQATLVIVAEYKLPNPKIVTQGLSLFTSSIRCTPESFGRDWISAVRNAFLIRDPAAGLASYIQKRGAVTLADIGIVQQHELFEREADRLGAAPPVVEGADVLADPAGILARLCHALGIDYTDAMLNWPAGHRDTDGVWAPAWYNAVEQSTGFEPPRPHAQITLPDDLRRIADAARPHYEALAAHRLRA